MLPAHSDSIRDNLPGFSFLSSRVVGERPKRHLQVHGCIAARDGASHGRGAQLDGVKVNLEASFSR